MTCSVIVRGPRAWILLDCRYGRVYFVGKPARGGTAPLGVPTSCGLSLLDGFVEILKLADHAQRPRRSGGEPLTMERSSLARHPPALAARGFRPTMQPPHRRRPLRRGSQSARRLEPPVPLARVAVPRPTVVGKSCQEITTGLRLRVLWLTATHRQRRFTIRSAPPGAYGVSRSVAACYSVISERYPHDPGRQGPRTTPRPTV